MLACTHRPVAVDFVAGHQVDQCEGFLADLLGCVGDRVVHVCMDFALPVHAAAQLQPLQLFAQPVRGEQLELLARVLGADDAAAGVLDLVLCPAGTEVPCG